MPAYLSISTGPSARLSEPLVVSSNPFVVQAALDAITRCLPNLRPAIRLQEPEGMESVDASIPVAEMKS